MNRVNDYYYKITIDRAEKKGLYSWREVCELRRQPGVVEITDKIFIQVYLFLQNPQSAAETIKRYADERYIEELKGLL